MTLVLTVVTPTKVVQVADCRLSREGGGHEGILARSKVMSVNTADGGFVMAYAGLASIGDEGECATDWLWGKLTGKNFCAHSSKDAVCHLTDILDRQFIENPAYAKYPFTVSVAGFTGLPFGRFVGMITNLGEKEFEQIGPPGRFRCFVCHPGEKAYRFEKIGFTQAIPDFVHDQSVDLLRRGFFANSSIPEIASQLAYWIQLISKSENSKGLIGSDCVSIGMEKEGDFITSFHSQDHPKRLLIPPFVSPFVSWGEGVMTFRDPPKEDGKTS